MISEARATVGATDDDDDGDDAEDEADDEEGMFSKRWGIGDRGVDDRFEVEEG